MANRTQSRRGVALLVALVVVMSVSTLAVGLLQRSQSGVTESLFALRSAQAGMLVDDLTPMLLEWSVTEADGVFLDADDPAAWVRIYESTAGDLNIRVHAIDCSGRLRVDRLDTFARLGLPSQFQRLSHAEIRIPNFNDAPDLRPLLETYTSDLQGPQPIAVFPDLNNLETSPAQLVLAQWITTHGDGALNVNTAPIPLLQAALRGLDPSAAREILALRKSEESVPASLIQSNTSRATNATKRLRLTTTSSAVGFIVTVKENNRRHHWWIVAEQRTVSQLRGPLGAAYGADANAIGNWRITEKRRINP